MSRHQVTCINKRGNHYDPHERISHIGGINSDSSRWKLSENEAIQSIEDGKYEFYVRVNGRSVDVIVAIHNGRKYLKTETDGYSPNNLLSLPECP
ncbi:DUF3892 domain-containing protein [Compostibacter hankyongensis]|uniref:DUF3892 domain-containing protein n=1 Tax=Compostibacter hankyongensis TaxID=1007089 RepID=A0ABP8FR60_9BACT